MARPDQTMLQFDGGTTSPALLKRVRAWHDHPAWSAFYGRYDPLLRSWCGRLRLDGDTSDELCQRIWVELMARMQSFRYDPSGGFRRWLWRLFESRAIDLLRHRQITQLPSIEGAPTEALCREQGPFDRVFDETIPSSDLMRAASEAQQAVCSRVDEQTWRAFWMIAIEDRNVREAADLLGKKYTAVYNGYRRVEHMLRLEGERRLAALLDAKPTARESD